MSKNAGQTKKKQKKPKSSMKSACPGQMLHSVEIFGFFGFGRRFCLCISKAFRFFWFFWVWPALFAHVCRDQPICSNSVRKPIRTSEPRRPVRTTNTISNRHWPACPEDGVRFVIYILFLFVLSFKIFGSHLLMKNHCFYKLSGKNGESRAPPHGQSNGHPIASAKTPAKPKKTQKT